METKNKKKINLEKMTDKEIEKFLNDEEKQKKQIFSKLELKGYEIFACRLK